MFLLPKDLNAWIISSIPFCINTLEKYTKRIFSKIALSIVGLNITGLKFGTIAQLVIDNSSRSRFK